MGRQQWVPQDTFGARLLLVRHQAGLTVEQASTQCGIPHPTWSSWEHGARPRDLIGVVAKVHCSLGVDRDWLLWGYCPEVQPDPYPVRRTAV